jgi:hypothetical protein
MLLAEHAPPLEGMASPVQLLLIIARHERRLFASLSEYFLDEPRIAVVVDRRRAVKDERCVPDGASDRRERRLAPDAPEDRRYHSAVIIARKQETEPRAPRSRRIAEGTTSMDTDDLGRERERLVQWITDGEDILTRLLPGLFDRCTTLQRRAEAAEAGLQQGQRELEDLRREGHRLRAQVDEARKDRADLADAMRDAMRELARVAEGALAKLGS